MRSIRYFILISISLLSFSPSAFAGAANNSWIDDNNGYAGFANHSNANISIFSPGWDSIKLSADQKWYTIDNTVQVSSVLNRDTNKKICTYSVGICVPTGAVFTVTPTGCSCVGCYNSFLWLCLG